MKKLILSLVAILAVTGSAKASLLGVYEFTGTSTSSTTASNAPTMTLNNVTANGITASANQVYNTSVWSTSATRDASKYVQFTFQTASSAVKIDSISFAYNSASSSGGSGKNGPTQGQIDIIVNNIVVGTSAFSLTADGNSYTLTSTFSTTVNSGDLATVRFYAWAAGTGSGGKQDMTLDNIALNGSTGSTPVPEPTNIALVLFGCTFAGVGVGRKFLKKKAA